VLLIVQALTGIAAACAGAPCAFEHLLAGVPTSPTYQREAETGVKEGK
jgi:hypothetical protein